MVPTNNHLQQPCLWSCTEWTTPRWIFKQILVPSQKSGSKWKCKLCHHNTKPHSGSPDDCVIVRGEQIYNRMNNAMFRCNDHCSVRRASHSQHQHRKTQTQENASTEKHKHRKTPAQKSTSRQKVGFVIGTLESESWCTTLFLVSPFQMPKVRPPCN